MTVDLCLQGIAAGVKRPRASETQWETSPRARPIAIGIDLLPVDHCTKPFPEELRGLGSQLHEDIPLL